MGLLQTAYETYEYHQTLAGRMEVGKESLCPCAHIITGADLELTIDAEGRFISAALLGKDEPKIIIPATESSASRSGKAPPPHPLCDKLAYLSPLSCKAGDKFQKFDAYMSQLERWNNSPYTHPKLGPIVRYLKGGTIVEDLLGVNVVTEEQGTLSKDSWNLFVRWRVLGLGEDGGACWSDPTLFAAFTNYYLHLKEREPSVLCMVTGKECPAADSHMKGVVSFHGNAKIISSNDSSNFTYRGRFTTPEQAETVGFEASQKAHNALHWLISNQGVSHGGRTFICWEPEGLAVPDPFAAFPVFDEASEERNGTPSQYRECLKNSLKGWRSQLPVERARAVIAAFDAATTGRLAVTYYRELQSSDFLQRIYDWDQHCCWYNGKFGIQSPSLYQIATCAFGTQRGDDGSARMSLDDRVLRNQIQRLLECRIEQAAMPMDIVRSLTQRASNPQAYEKKIWYSILFTACAVIKKYHHDHKEECMMALETDKKDRSYQYGRMLAILEKAERDTYNSEEKRESNAIRMMSVYAKRPRYASRVIWERVKTAYYPKLHPGTRAYYDRLLQEIWAILADTDSEMDRPLGDTYLMGYYLQRKELYTKHNEENGGTEE